jgi:hypothetical protein
VRLFWIETAAGILEAIAFGKSLTAAIWTIEVV